MKWLLPLILIPSLAFGQGTLPPVEPDVISVTQTAHGFVTGNLVYLNGTTYALASNATKPQAEVKGIVLRVSGANNFVLKTHGEMTGLSGLAAGTVYFLGTGGAMTPTEPTAVGTVDKPVFLATSSTGGTFINMRGIVNVAPASSVTGPASSVNSDVALFNGTTGKVLKDGGALGSNAFTSTAYLPLTGGTLTGDLTLSTHNLITDTTTGTKIGTATGQKLGFFNATPVVQQSGDALTALSNLGLVATPTLTSADVGLGNVPNVDATNASNISSGTLSNSRLSTGTGATNVVLGGTITAGGPTGSGTVVPVITYNAAGQLTAVSTSTITATVTNTGGALTANRVVLGAGTNDTKVVPGIITDGTSALTLGVAGTSVGSIAFNNATSGTATLSPTTGALGTVTANIPAANSTMVQANTGSANNFVTGISSQGVVSTAQPSYSNLSGTDNGGWTILQVTGSNFSTSSTSLVNVTGLVSGTVSASTTYEVEIVLDLTTSADSNGIKFGFNSTGTSPGGQVVWVSGPGGTAAGSVSITAVAASSVAFVTTSAANGSAYGHGFIKSGTGSPVLSVQVLKPTSGTATVNIGSVFKYRVLGQ